MSCCELCGKETSLLRSVIEGAALNVCQNCSKYGKVIETKILNQTKRSVIKNEIVEDIVDNYNKIIKNKREQMGINLKDFALKLNEKENLISKIENGSLKPDFKLALKIGKFLNISLIHSELNSNEIVTKNKSQGLTIGDFIKTK